MPNAQKEPSRAVTASRLIEAINREITASGTMRAAAASLGVRSCDLGDAKRGRAGRKRRRMVAQALNLTPIDRMDSDVLAWKIANRKEVSA